METIEKVIAAARGIANGPANLEGFRRARQRRAGEVADALAAKGFPETDAERAARSLVPLLFQEADYDDVDWTSQAADLRQLQGSFELDHLAQSGGLTRKEASAAAFADYIKASFRAIEAQRR